uniref:Uncharacterized protein n=1 Tax=Anopheles atroparvus TaxID=41427 RepID=A0A182IKA5_ANOAO
MTAVGGGGGAGPVPGSCVWAAAAAAAGCASVKLSIIDAMSISVLFVFWFAAELGELIALGAVNALVPDPPARGEPDPDELPLLVLLFWPADPEPLPPAPGEPAPLLAPELPPAEAACEDFLLLDLLSFFVGGGGGGGFSPSRQSGASRSYCTWFWKACGATVTYNGLSIVASTFMRSSISASSFFTDSRNFRTYIDQLQPKLYETPHVSGSSPDGEEEKPPLKPPPVKCPVSAHVRFSLVAQRRTVGRPNLFSFTDSIRYTLSASCCGMPSQTTMQITINDALHLEREGLPGSEGALSVPELKQSQSGASGLCDFSSLSSSAFWAGSSGSFLTLLDSFLLLLLLLVVPVVPSAFDSPSPAPWLLALSFDLSFFSPFFDLLFVVVVPPPVVAVVAGVAAAAAGGCCCSTEVLFSPPSAPGTRSFVGSGSVPRPPGAPPSPYAPASSVSSLMGTSVDGRRLLFFGIGYVWAGICCSKLV